MSSSGYLVAPREDASKEHLWNETWTRIDRFLPDLRNDLIPDEPEIQPEKQAEDRHGDEIQKGIESINGSEPPLGDGDETKSDGERGSQS